MTRILVYSHDTNTIGEVASVGAYAVVVPRVRPVEEQRIRAERLARLGIVTSVDPDAMTPQSLGGAVLEALDADRSRVRASLDLDALLRIAGCIWAGAGSAEARHPAGPPIAVTSSTANVAAFVARDAARRLPS